MDNAPAPRGRRNPTVIAAIIAAVATIIVAIIGLAPKSPSLDTKQQQLTINQRASGPGSAAVGQAGGNVTIILEMVYSRATSQNGCEHCSVGV